MVRSGRVLPNTNPIPKSDTKKFRKRKIAKKVVAISASRSQRGNKQYFNLGLIAYKFQMICFKGTKVIEQKPQKLVYAVFSG